MLGDREDVNVEDNDDEKNKKLESNHKTFTKQGVIQKWTNYLQGWQNRFVSCADATLCYCKTQEEGEHGYKVTTRLSGATVKTIPFDPYRFDVIIDDNSWYFMASSETERDEWVAVIEANKYERVAGDVSMSTASSAGADALSEKVLELKTYCSILDRQISALRQCFEICEKQHGCSVRTTSASGKDNASVTENVETTVSHLDIDQNRTAVPHLPDVNGEVITFRATAVGVLESLNQCIAIVGEREMMWKDKFAKAQEEKEQMSRNYAKLVKEMQKFKVSKCTTILSADSESEYDSANEDVPCVNAVKTGHEYSDEIDKRVKEILANPVQQPDAESDGLWDLLVEEGDLKVYRQDYVLDNGVLCDTIKAVHSVGNVTAREVCHYFWNTDLRTEWEETVETCTTLKVLDDNTKVIYQTHKKVWMAAQRDCLYVSSVLQTDDTAMVSLSKTPHDTWVVCNFSVDEEVEDQVQGCVRATADVTLVCRTFLSKPENKKHISREQLTCDLVYTSNVNPGGYVPTALLRQISKREYPKMLRRLSAYVQEKTQDQEIWF